MKELKVYLFIALLAGVIGFGGATYLFSSKHPVFASRGETLQVYFSPKGGCTEAVVAQINAAQKSILVQAYSFTSQPIEAALIEAKKRGVEVKVVLDRSQYEAKGAAAGPLHDAKIEIRMDIKHQIAHNKVIIIDEAVVLTGSFNFTRQAEIGNAENLIIISNPDIAQHYAGNWNAHYEHSDPYNGETSRPRK